MCTTYYPDIYDGIKRENEREEGEEGDYYYSHCE